MAPPDRQTLIDTAMAFTTSYDKWTLESTLAVRTADCIHQIHPASLQRPAMTNQDLEAFFESIKRLYQNYRIRVHDGSTLVDIEKRTVILHAEGTADTILGPFKNEYIFLLTMDERGKKLCRIDEFVDSAAVVSMVPRIKAEWEKRSS